MDKKATGYPPKRFEALVQEFREREEEILGYKRNEYSNDEDRLQNFREVANFVGCGLPEVALIWLLKHIQSISLAVAVETSAYKWVWTTEAGHEGLKQRIADARNYLLLLAACIDEEVVHSD